MLQAERVLTLLRHAVAVAVLPVTAAILVPVWIAGEYAIEFSMASAPGGLLLQIGGVVAAAVGLVLFVASLRRFAGEGQGTLAPWDPPRRLVVRGPYRYVRNPMISGVLFVIIGEAMILRSIPHAVWAAAFALINLIYIRGVEEPALRKRFGEEYETYARRVPRFFPRGFKRRL